MAVVPTTRPSSQLRTAGAAPSVAASGAVGAAIAGVGREVSAIGSEALNRQRQADNAAFRTERSNTLSRSWTERLAEAETTGSEVDLGTLKDEFDADVERLGDGAPSDEAGQAFKLDADNAFSKKFFPGFAKNQSKINVKKRVNATTGALDDINAEVLTGRTSVAEALGRAESAIVGLGETAGGVVDIGKLRENTRNGIGRNALTSVIETDPRQALDEMNAGKWDKLTSAPDLQRLRQAATSALTQQGNQARKKFSSDIDNYVALLSSGTADTPQMQERFSESAIRATFGDQADTVIEAVGDAREFGQARNEVKSASPEQLNTALVKNKPTGVDQFSREARQFQVLNQVISQRNTEIAKDPAAYSVANSPEVSDSFGIFQQSLAGNDPELIEIAAGNYTNASRSFQEHIGVHDKGVQFLPAQMEDAIGQRLNDFSQGGENVAIQINALKEGFGDEWGSVLGQLQLNKKIGTGVRVMAGMPFGPEQIALGEAVAIGQKGFKEVINPDDFKAIKDTSRDALEEFHATLRGQPGSEAAFGQYKAAIETLSMKYLADGVEDSSADALERAVDDVLNKNFSFTDTYRIPVAQNAEEVENGVDFMVDKLRAGDIDLRIPDSATLPGGKEILKDTGQITTEGRPVFINQSGDLVTERTSTVGLDGKFFNIPTVFDGGFVEVREAIDRVAQAGFTDPITGRKLKAFDTQEEATAAAEKRSPSLLEKIDTEAVRKVEPPIDVRKEVYLSVLQPNPITAPDGSGILFTDQNGNALLETSGEPVIVPWGRLEFLSQDVDISRAENLRTPSSF